MPTLPGFVDAHCHAFQRALRGRGRGGDFWGWRDEMIALAGSLSLAEIRSEYLEVYRELRANGYTAVGEFHYLGLEEAQAAAAAAAEAGIAFVCLYACYLRGGIPRFRQESVAAYLGELEALRDAGIRVGVAPHSVRACPAEALGELGRYAAEHELPLHVHADEQPREIDECLAEHGLRPIELLAREGCLGPRSTIVHATHADGGELDLLRDSGSRICVCPTTEANLGRRLPAGRARLPPADRHVHRLGLERAHRPARGAARARGHRAPADRQARSHPRRRLLCDRLGGGCRCARPRRVARRERRPRAIRSSAGSTRTAVYEALVFSCTGDVLRKMSDQ